MDIHKKYANWTSLSIAAMFRALAVLQWNEYSLSLYTYVASSSLDTVQT